MIFHRIVVSILATRAYIAKGLKESWFDGNDLATVLRSALAARAEKEGKT